MNLELLKDKIEEINIPKTTIAKKMGISRNSLHLKLEGSRAFKMSEANSISEILRLTNRERTSIFFGVKDDKNVN